MARKRAITPWVCRLYPEQGSTLYARVQVWPTKQSFLDHMNAHYTSFGNRGFGKRCDGACGRYHSTSFKSGRARRSPCFAVVNLWQGCLTMRVVTHELFHATMAWAHRVGFSFDPIMASLDVTQHEERITYVHGELCREFMCKASDRNGPYVKLGSVRSH